MAAQALTLLAQPQAGATLAAAATTYSAVYNIPGIYSNVIVALEIGAAPTGTSPTIVVNIQTSLDGANFFTVGTGITSQNAAGVYQCSNTLVAWPMIKLQYVVGGTSPSFTALTTNIYVY